MITKDKLNEKNVHLKTLSDRFKASQWMVETVRENGDIHIASKYVSKFQQMFSGKSKTNLMKAGRWRKSIISSIGFKDE